MGLELCWSPVRAVFITTPLVVVFIALDMGYVPVISTTANAISAICVQVKSLISDVVEVLRRTI